MDGTEWRSVLLVVIGAVLAVVGGAVAGWGYGADGAVAREDVRFETGEGRTLAGTLYLPDGVDADDPAPGVVALHGYTGSRETMAPLAVELARRGYVVLAVDQPGHGESDPPAFADDWGGPAALEYLREHPAVEADTVGLVGHSMGGFAAMAAAAKRPDGYESLVLIGSTPAVPAAPPANGTFPRNLLVVWGAYDEYSATMWDTRIPDRVGHSQRMRSLAGTAGPVEPGRVYGNVSAGTARSLAVPPTIHTTEHLSPDAIRRVVAWIQRTLGGADADPAPQIWHEAAAGGAVALLGVLLAFVDATALACRRLDLLGPGPAVEDGDLEDGVPPDDPRPSADGDGPLPDGGDGDRDEDAGADSSVTPDWRAALATGGDRRVVAGLIVAVPALSYYPLLLAGSAVLPPTPLTPQSLTNAVLLWGLSNALLVGAAIAWLRRRGRLAVRLWAPVVAGTDRELVARSLAAGLAGAAVALGLGIVVERGFDGLVRAWVLVVDVPGALRTLHALLYAPWLVAAALALGVGLHRVLAVPPGRPLGRELARNLGLTCGGLLALAVVQYVPLFLGAGLPIPALASGTVFAAPTLAIVGTGTVVSTVLHRRTGLIWPGAVAVAALWAILVVGSGAIHV